MKVETEVRTDRQKRKMNLSLGEISDDSGWRLRDQKTRGILNYTFDIASRSAVRR